MALSTPELAGRLRGVWTALVTPFRGGKLDEGKLREIVDAQVAAGIDGLVPCGSTGESPTLPFAEHKQVIRVTVEAAHGRIPVVAGAGTNSTEETLALCRDAREVGADGVLLVAPYYNRPSQRGIFLHFQAVFDAIDIPVVLYNIPGRTGVNVEPDTVSLIEKLGKLAGIKEAAGSCDQVSRLLELCGPDFPVLCGDDSLTLPFMSVGACGVISVVSNIAPREMAAMVRAFRENRGIEALELHRRLFPLIKALFIETNPVPVKTAMGLLGLCTDELRLPLAAMEEGNVVRLRKAMRDFGFKV